MLTKLKFLFKDNSTEPILPHDFEQLVRKAIILMKDRSDVNTDEEFLAYLTSNGIPYSPAVEILLFLPIAFVRQWIPSVKWLDTYLEYIDENKQIEKLYFETKAFQIIWDITTEYFSNNPDGDTVFKIGGRSAEFNLINKVLLDNPNSQIEEIVLHRTMIMR